MTPKQRSIYPRILLTGFLLLCLLAAFVFGLLAGKNKTFPYQLVASVKQSISPSPYAITTHRQRRSDLFDVAGGESNIVFIGDSHTEFGLWNTPFPDQNVANRGIQEDTSADVLKRVDSILSTQPKQAFVMIGINDIFKNIAINNIVDNYRELVRTLKNNNIDVVIQSTVQCHLAFCGQDKIDSVNELNEQLGKLSEEEGVRFLSLGQLSESQGLATSLTFDGIHLTPQGYQIWISALKQFLNQ